MGKTKTQIHSYFNQDGFNKMKCLYCGWITATNATRMLKHIKTQCRECPAFVKNKVLIKKIKEDRKSSTETSLKNGEGKVTYLVTNTTCTSRNSSMSKADLITAKELSIIPDNIEKLETSKKAKKREKNSYSSSDSDVTDISRTTEDYQEEVEIKEVHATEEKYQKDSHPKLISENEHLLYARYIATQFQKLPLEAYENIKIKIQTMLSAEIVAMSKLR